jgi:hypothetical protein
MKKIPELIIPQVLAAIILYALNKIPSVQWFWQTFFVELWWLWLALIVGGAYWLARDYIGLRRTVKKLEVEPHNREVYFQSLSDIARTLEGRITKLEMKGG